MQIDRRPSRWPYVVALVVLLGLCLTIPMYWQAARKPGPEVSRAPARVDMAMAWPTEADLEGADGFTPVTRSDPMEAPSSDVRSGDTIEALLAALANRPIPAARPYAAAADDSDAFANLLAPHVANAKSQSAVALEPFVTAVFEQAGYGIAQYSLPQMAGVAARIAADSQVTVKPSRHVVAAPVSIGNPHQHLKFAPRFHGVGDAPGAGTGEAVDIAPEEGEFTEPLPGTSAELDMSPWSEPIALVRRLELLSNQPYTADWAHVTLEQLRMLTENRRSSGDEVSARLAELHSLSAQCMELADASHDDCVRAELLRAHWGLERRLSCWSLMRDIAVASATKNRFAARTPWGQQPNVETGQGTPSVDLQSLSENLETYERIRSPRIARTIIQRQRELMESNDPVQRDLAEKIEENYRNANVRVAISADLLKRFMPEQQAEMQAVNDRIAGTPVRGQSQTFAENSVQLAPDSQRWNLGLKSDGTVISDTVTVGGPVRVRTHGQTEFTADKSVVVVPEGQVQVGRATAEARTQNRLVGIQSNYDWAPVIGELIRNSTIKQYREKQPRARAEVEYKVSRRVEEQLDCHADDAVAQVEQDVRDRFFTPMADAGVDLTTIELSTTDIRLIARLRVAGKDQLGGHTPRPRAPGDSLASMQVHESAFTNAALSLKLDGQRYTAPELQQVMRDKFSRLRDQPEMDVKSDTTFTFAAQDALRFRVADEHLEVIVTMDEVNLEGTPVRNFRVHAFYKPEIHGLEVDLVRDGALGVEGRIRTGDRARMHGVFNKVLSEDRRIPLITLKDKDDPRLAGLMITQIVLDDGWLGMAVGPEISGRQAQQTRVLR